eukprot:m.255939 g.255939  ORF g.255939 m.255939 type:complete len:212 (-) comp11013_c0_seq1:118-753(-)
MVRGGLTVSLIVHNQHKNAPRRGTTSRDGQTVRLQSNHDMQPCHFPLLTKDDPGPSPPCSLATRGKGDTIVCSSAPPAAMAGVPGTASLLEEIDKKLLCILRDGRKLIGYLRSIDQFANLVLQDTIERIYVGNRYGDIDRGIYLIRGENVVLLGEIDQNDENPGLIEVSVEEILELQREDQLARVEQEKMRNKVLLDRGFQPETLFDDIYS